MRAKPVDHPIPFTVSGTFVNLSVVSEPSPFSKRLADLLPPSGFRTDLAALATMESDGLTAFAKRPLGVATPETTDQVISIVRACHEFGVPFVARGSGTSLSGGSVPVEGGIVLALNRLNQILSVDPDRRVAVVQPGVVNAKVSEAALPYGLHFAPDPSSGSVCTIGGNVAFNSGGAHCLRYGMTANHVLGMKVVAADGEIFDWRPGCEEAFGSDPSALFCGSEGLFGVALEIELRLIPKPESWHTVLVGYETLAQAGEAVAAVIAAGILPGAMEIMDALSIEAAEAAVACDYPPNCGAVLIVELEGPRESVDAQVEQLAAVIADTQPKATVIAKSAEQRATIWKGRKSAFSAVGRLSPDFLVQDGVVPRSRLGEALQRIEAIAQTSGIRVANVFHAGDGNLHPLIMYDGRIPGELDRAEKVAGKILDVCIEMGGSITGEHGVGLEKRDYLNRMFDEPSLDWMRRLRAAMDPRHISNPGKMFPTSGPPSLTMSGLHPLEKQGVIERH